MPKAKSRTLAGRRFLTYLIFSACTLFVYPLASQTPDLLKEVRDSLNKVKPFSVEFTQQVYYDQELSIEESGLITFQDIKKIRWEYQDPDVKIAIIKNDEYKFYEADTNQVSIGKINANNKKWIWQLLFADDLTGSIRCDKIKKIIYIKDSDADMDFEVYVDDDNLLSKVVHRDPTGALNVYLFSGYKKNISVAPIDFDIDVPNDAEVIRTEDL